jgi:hypothetical protein
MFERPQPSQSHGNVDRCSKVTFSRVSMPPSRNAQVNSRERGSVFRAAARDIDEELGATRDNVFSARDRAVLIGKGGQRPEIGRLRISSANPPPSNSSALAGCPTQQVSTCLRFIRPPRLISALTP